jgi:hypothetical protein
VSAGPGGFAASRERFEEMAGWLDGAGAAGLAAAELEDLLQAIAVSCSASCSRITWTCGSRGRAAAVR